MHPWRCVTWTFPFKKTAVRAMVDGQSPAAFLLRPRHSQAAPSQPVTEHSRGPRGRPFLLTWDNPVRKTCPLLSWVIFALEISILQAKIFSEPHFRKGFCYTILPPCPSPFTDVRPTLVFETLPTLPSTSLDPSGAFSRINLLHVYLSASWRTWTDVVFYIHTLLLFLVLFILSCRFEFPGEWPNPRPTGWKHTFHKTLSNFAYTLFLRSTILAVVVLLITLLQCFLFFFPF